MHAQAAQQQQQQQQHAAGLANLAQQNLMQQQRRDAMKLKGMYLLRLMQFSEHLSGFPVRGCPYGK
jgi:type II secretory pathway pseudopilin PulG